MTGKLERDAAGGRDALAHPLCEFEVVTVARREIGARLSDADNGLLALQLLGGEAVIEIPLEVEGGHSRILRIVEPEP